MPAVPSATLDDSVQKTSGSSRFRASNCSLGRALANSLPASWEAAFAVELMIASHPVRLIDIVAASAILKTFVILFTCLVLGSFKKFTNWPRKQNHGRDTRNQENQSGEPRDARFSFERSPAKADLQELPED